MKKIKFPNKKGNPTQSRSLSYSKKRILKPQEKNVELPDVAEHKSSLYSPLPRVGMDDIHLPILWQGNTLVGKVGFFVNLSKIGQRGIHMSRLYLILQEHLAHKELDWKSLNECCFQALSSHHGVSDQVSIKIEMQLPFEQHSLLSNLKSLRQIPFEVIYSNHKSVIKKILKTKVIYSSTCPASSALATQVLSEDLGRFSSVMEIKDYLNKFGLPATPHAQRSTAEVAVEITDSKVKIPFKALVSLIEGALKTQVQGSVKRVDEQEFARLNAQNLMFCEDAARRIESSIKKTNGIGNFYGKVSHLESLHAHNAVSFFGSSAFNCFE